ncbi:MBL fold metallo-hydrolase [Portibacter lacus]|uniref:MBL fold metallo-hydrolase n=1 Tax=Portibacter lacus TaxID=1099794 RepID=A0AA37SLP9_9BACT|nr:MBL fold metallo-hydrolase [Portibacter lacus]GLR15652.1 MBL fold metallo-hydrolase [Portibacter lacus]
MQVEQIYTGCLSQGSYFISSDGEAVVIDPLRETKPYLDRAKKQGVKIKYILETHFHADFVSGHIDLAKASGATIIYGPGASTSFEMKNAKDGETLKVGKISFKVLHTPGHTPESTCYLLNDESGKEYAVFTGDTLFIGDVGRPDLAQKATDLTKEDLAGWLFDSLREKLMPLPDHTIVYPAHGAGSACGKKMSSETWDTLGHQKETNYALRADMTRAEFVAEVTRDLLPPPQYFSENVKLNKEGYTSITEVMAQGARALSVDDFEYIANQEDVLVLDVRNKQNFVKGFIPGSIFIGLDGSFAPWVGALVTNLEQKILIVAPEGQESEAVKRLARVGYDNALGFLDGGFGAWNKEVDQIETISVEEFVGSQLDKKILDVRKPDEWETAHIEGAQHFPLDFINDHMGELNSSTSYVIHCRSGYRSTIAASILKARGYDMLINVHGSFDVIKFSELEVSGNCPSLVS